MNDIEKKLKKYIKENYEGENLLNSLKALLGCAPVSAAPMRKNSARKDSAVMECEESVCEESVCFSVLPELEKRLKMKDESFPQMLMRKIDELGIKDSECYTKAHISKQVFSKIRCKENYHPTKQTVLAFAVALKLDFEETSEMLRKAGYAFAKNNYFDIIVSFFIQESIYDISTINEYLYQYDQVLLGNDEK